MVKKIIGYVVASILLVGIVVTLWLLFTGKLLPEYTVSFETNSMAGQTVEPVTVRKGKTISEPELELEEMPSAEGDTDYFRVSAWYTDEALETAWDFSRGVEEDMTLYAAWEEVDVFAVTVYVNGNREAPVLFHMQSGSVVSAPELRAALFGELGLSGLPFLTAEFRFTEYGDAEGVITVTEDMQLFAVIGGTDDCEADWTLPETLPAFTGEALDLSGLSLTLSYEGGSTVFDYDPENAAWSVSEFDGSLAGMQRVTVRYGRIFSHTFEIELEQVRATELSVQPQGEQEYFYQTRPDYAEWRFSVRFNNGESVAVDPADVDMTIPEFTESGNYPVTFTSREYGVSGTVDMYFFDRQEGDYFEIQTVAGDAMIAGLTNEGRNMRELVVPAEVNGSRVTAIVAEAFRDAQALEAVYLPEGLAEIGEGAFRGCSSLKKVAFISGNTQISAIKDEMFMGCSALTELSFWGTVRTVGDSAFEGCSVWAGDVSALTQAGTRAFYGCNALGTVTLDAFTSIGTQAFGGISGGLEVIVRELQAQLPADLFADTFVTSLVADLRSVDAEALGMFKAMPSLRRWTIAGDIPAEFLKDNAYVEQVALVLPSSIGASAFENCPSLRIVLLSASEERLTIGENAFLDCFSLRTFLRTDDLGEAAYSELMWGYAETLLAASFRGVTFGQTAFKNCAFAFLTLTDCILAGDSVFENNLSLQEVTLAVTGAAGAGTFRGCTALTSVTGTAESVSEEMFRGCSSLETFALGGYTALGSFALEGTPLTQFVLPATLRELSETALYGLSLAQITVEEGASFLLDSGILYDAARTTLYKSETSQEFTKITIPESVSKIAPRAFEGVEKLDSIIVYRYQVPVFGEEWNYGSFVRVECNPFSADAYIEALGASLVTPIAGDTYYCITFDPQLGADEVRSYIVSLTGQVTDDMRPTPETYQDATNGLDALLPVSYPFRPTQNMLLTVGKGWKIDYVFEEGTVPAENAPQWVREGQIAVLVAPERENYLFAGWALPDGTIVTEIGYDDYQANVVLHATWAPQYNIIYVSEFPMELSDDCPLWLREEETRTLGTAASKGYHIFEGWLLNGERVESLSYAELSGDVELVADWYVRRKVQYVYGNDVTLTVPESAQWMTEEADAVLPVPSRAGYEFKEWRLDGGEAVTSLSCKDFTADIVRVTAVWWGTQEAPYLIASREDLLAAAARVNGNPYHYRLVADLNLGNWTPVPDNYGVFDGGGHTVTYSISIPVGNVTAASVCFSGLFGQNRGEIFDLHTVATIRTQDAYHDASNWVHAGGIVGLNYGTVRDCSAQVDINMDRKESNAGGIAGKVSSGSIIGCSASGTLRGNGNMGGIVGECAGGVIESCTPHGLRLGYYYVGSNRGVGGIAGYVSGGSQVNRCAVSDTTVYYENDSSNNKSISPYFGAMIGYILDSSTLHNSAENVTVDKGALKTFWSWFVTYNQYKYVGGNIGRSENSNIQ